MQNCSFPFKSSLFIVTVNTICCSMISVNLVPEIIFRSSFSLKLNKCWWSGAGLSPSFTHMHALSTFLVLISLQMVHFKKIFKNTLSLLFCFQDTSISCLWPQNEHCKIHVTLLISLIKNHSQDWNLHCGTTSWTATCIVCLCLLWNSWTVLDALFEIQFLLMCLGKQQKRDQVLQHLQTMSESNEGLGS